MDKAGWSKTRNGKIKYERKTHYYTDQDVERIATSIWKRYGWKAQRGWCLSWIGFFEDLLFHSTAARTREEAQIDFIKTKLEDFLPGLLGETFTNIRQEINKVLEE